MTEKDSAPENVVPAKPIVATADEVQTAKALWDEYKHRHDLIWKMVFQVTTAVVILSVVPYLAPHAVRYWLEHWIVAAPVLASVLVLFSIVVVNHERTLLARIRQPYWLLQKDRFGVPHEITDETEEIPRTIVHWFVIVYFIGLAVLSATSSVICATIWSY